MSFDFFSSFTLFSISAVFTLLIISRESTDSKKTALTYRLMASLFKYGFIPLAIIAFGVVLLPRLLHNYAIYYQDNYFAAIMWKTSLWNLYEPVQNPSLGAVNFIYTPLYYWLMYPLAQLFPYQFNWLKIIQFSVQSIVAIVFVYRLERHLAIQHLTLIFIPLFVTLELIDNWIYLLRGDALTYTLLYPLVYYFSVNSQTFKSALIQGSLLGVLIVAKLSFVVLIVAYLMLAFFQPIHWLTLLITLGTSAGLFAILNVIYPHMLEWSLWLTLGQPFNEVVGKIIYYFQNSHLLSFLFIIATILLFLQPQSGTNHRFNHRFSITSVLVNFQVSPLHRLLLISLGIFASGVLVSFKVGGLFVYYMLFFVMLPCLAHLLRGNLPSYYPTFALLALMNSLFLIEQLIVNSFNNYGVLANTKKETLELSHFFEQLNGSVYFNGYESLRPNQQPYYNDASTLAIEFKDAKHIPAFNHYMQLLLDKKFSVLLLGVTCKNNFSKAIIKGTCEGQLTEPKNKVMDFRVIESLLFLTNDYRLTHVIQRSDLSANSCSFYPQFVFVHKSFEAEFNEAVKQSSLQSIIKPVEVVLNPE